MDKFQCARVSAGQVDAGYSGVEDLFEECAECVAAFVIYPVFSKEATVVSPLLHFVTEIDIFSKAHIGETTNLVKYLFLYPHIECTGIEFVGAPLVSSYTSGGDDGGHRVVNGFL